MHACMDKFENIVEQKLNVLQCLLPTFVFSNNSRISMYFFVYPLINITWSSKYSIINNIKYKLYKI